VTGVLSGFAYTDGSFFDPRGSVSYVVDDYSDGGLFEYERADEPWSVDDTSDTLVGDGPGTNSGGLLVSRLPGDGGPLAVPQRGDTITVEWETGPDVSSTGFYFFFGAQTTGFDDRYQVSFRLADGEVRFTVDAADGSGGTLAIESVTSPYRTNARYRTTIQWRDDRAFEIVTVDVERGEAIANFITAPDTSTGGRWDSGRTGFYVEPDTAFRVHRVRVLRPVSQVVVDDFDDGLEPRWHAPTQGALAPAIDRAYRGAGSAFTADPQISQPQAAYAFDTAERFSWLTVAFNETMESTGGGLRFRNSNGDYEIGFGTDNPQWIVDDADGARVVSDPNNDYDHWVVVTIMFDWQTEEAVVAFESVSDGVEHEGTYFLRHGVDIATAEVWGYKGGFWGDDTAVVLWVDELEYGSGQQTANTRPQSLSVTDRDFRTLLVTCNAVGPFTDFYQSLDAGAAINDYSRVRHGDENTAYRASGLREGQRYHFRASNSNSSQLSNEASAVTALHASTNVAATGDGSVPKVDLLWTKADNNPAGNHEILRNGTIVDQIGADREGYTDQSVTEDRTYDYTIRRNTPDAAVDSAKVSADTETTTLVESFEGGRADLSPWDISTVTWDVTTRNATDGSRALNFIGQSQNNPAGHDGVLQSPVDRFPGAGDTVAFDWTIHNDDVNYEFWFGFQNYDRYNYVGYNGSDKNLVVGVYDGGTRFIEHEVSYDVVQGQTLTGRIPWQSNGHFFFEYDGRTLDSRNKGRTHETGSGKVGLRANSNGDADIDWIRIEK